MKKNIGTRILAMTLSTAMMMSMAVCASDQEETKVNEGLEPITLTIGTMSATIGEGIHTEEYPVLKAIEEATGVTLDFVYYDSEKFTVLAAGGDLPDIVCLDDTSNMTYTLAESGQIIRLNELIEEYGQNIQARIPASITRNSTVSPDGESIYYMSTSIKSLGDVPAKNGFVGFKARYDIYKAIGSPEINNEDDYLAVLKQMQDYQREQTGDDSIYALSAFADSGVWPYIIAYPFSHGCMNGLAASYSMETGEYNYYYEADSIFMDGMRFFNKAYRMGIFDPDGFTQTWTQYDAKVANGEVLCSMSFAEVDPTVCGEEAICVYLPGKGMPYLSGVYTTPYPYGNDGYQARAISANCEYPERAMQLLDWLDSTEGSRIVANGIQGVDWDYVDGKPQYIGDMLQSYLDETSAAYKEERGLVDLTCYISGTTLTCDDGYPVSIEATEDFIAMFATTAEKAFAQDFDPSFTYPGQVYDKWVKEGIVETDFTEVGMQTAGLMPAASTETFQKVSEMDSYFMSNVPKLVMAETDEAFEQEMNIMLEKFADLGWEEVKAELQNNEAIAKESFNAMYGE